MADKITPHEGGEVQGSEPPNSMRLAGAIVTEYLSALDQRALGAVRHVPTGLASIDRQLPAVLYEGHLVILAGRPAIGKTALAQQIAENVAAANRSVFFFSLEMSGYEVTERAVSRRSGIPVAQLKMGEVDSQAWSRLLQAADMFGRLPMLIDDASFDIKGLVANAKAAAAGLADRGLPPLGAIFVDYLQLVSSNAANRMLEVGQVTAGLKQLACELSVPVVVLSQLSRGVEARVDKRPTMADLCESGSIERDADLILFIYRDEYYNDNSAECGVAEIIVGKNRHGSTSTVKLAFMGERVLFGDLV